MALFDVKLTADGSVVKMRLACRIALKEIGIPKKHRTWRCFTIPEMVGFSALVQLFDSRVSSWAVAGRTQDYGDVYDPVVGTRV